MKKEFDDLKKAVLAEVEAKFAKGYEHLSTYLDDIKKGSSFIDPVADRFGVDHPRESDELAYRLRESRDQIQRFNQAFKECPTYQSVAALDETMLEETLKSAQDFVRYVEYMRVCVHTLKG